MQASFAGHLKIVNELIASGAKVPSGKDAGSSSALYASLVCDHI